MSRLHQLQQDGIGFCKLNIQYLVGEGLQPALTSLMNKLQQCSLHLLQNRQQESSEV